MQSLYMKELKAGITPLTEIILQGDFAENFSYVVQDEIQSFHWENKQATLHPFVAYCRMTGGTLEHRNICVVSDSREHSTVTVHAFLRVVIPYLQTQFSDMKKIHYFTDGCAGQYKNRNRSQPFVICLYQESMLIPTQVFVILERKALAKASLLKAVDGCYKLTYVLNIKFQDNCKLAWHFLQHYIYSQGRNEQLAASVRAFRSYVQQIHET